MGSHATNTTCVKYLEKILPYYDADNGSRTWADQVKLLCINPELDAKETQVKTATDQANAEIQSRTLVLHFAKKVSAQIRLQTSILKALRLKFENCRKSPVHTVACSDAQIEIAQIIAPLSFANRGLIAEAQSLPEHRRADFVIRLTHSNSLLNQFAAKFKGRK